MGRLLTAAKDAIVRDWAAAVRADPRIQTDRSLSYTEFIDHIPKIVEEICRLLSGRDTRREAEQIKEDAEIHGAFRWRQGYDLGEVMRETAHLRTVLLEHAARAGERLGARGEEQLDFVQLVLRVVDEGQVETILTYVREREREDAERQAADAERERAFGARERELQEVLLQRERERVEALEEAARLKDDFLATLSHEIRTPLNAMVGWLALLRGRTLDAEATARALDALDRNARAQEQLVNDLLDVSRIVAGQMRLEPRPTDLADVIRAAADIVRPAALARGITLEFHLDPDVRPVFGDPARLQQVAWNLLSNAVKFSPASRRVEVRLERADEGARLVVADEGRGIAPEDLPWVFDRFRQGSRTGFGGGLGLGLAIVRHLVEAHGGTVRAESEGAGRGATFTVELPSGGAAAEPVAARRPPDEAEGGLAAGESLAGARILVVEDDPDSRELLRTLLDEFGAETRVAASAAEGLEALRTWRPEVLVSDVAMSGDDGYALLRQVRALPPEEGGATPALALTAYASLEDRLRSVEAGFQMHVNKPTRPAELLQALALLIRRGRAGASTAAASAGTAPGGRAPAGAAFA
jgi:signal transduction histidine kinase/ActR/RegA family two-component response regulator